MEKKSYQTEIIAALCIVVMVAVLAGVYMIAAKARNAQDRELLISCANNNGTLLLRYTGQPACVTGVTVVQIQAPTEARLYNLR